jgi:hypothetical protein
MLSCVCLNCKFWPRIEKMGVIFSEQVKMGKNAYMRITPFSNNCLLKEDLSKISQKYTEN